MATDRIQTLLLHVANCVAATTATSDSSGRAATAFTENASIIGDNTPIDRGFDVLVRRTGPRSATGTESGTQQVARTTRFDVVLHYVNPQGTARDFSGLVARDVHSVQDRVPKYVANQGVGDAVWPDGEADFEPVALDESSMLWRITIPFVAEYREDLTTS